MSQPLTANNLRKVADTLDSLSAVVLNKVPNLPKEIRAILESSEMQDDIRKWATELGETP